MDYSKAFRSNFIYTHVKTVVHCNMNGLTSVLLLHFGPGGVASTVEQDVVNIRAKNVASKVRTRHKQTTWQECDK